MKIYETSVKKPITTSLIFIAIIVLGLFSLSKLSIDQFPEIEMNTAIVLVSYPGASAEDVENNVTKVMESALSTVSDLKKLKSTSKENTAIISVEFNWGTDLDAAVNDMRDKIEMVKSYLPDGCSNPMIMKISTDMMPITIISATADESTAALYKILDDGVANPLNRINGVGSVSISGAPQREIIVDCDPTKLEAYNLTVEQIGSVIAKENVSTPGGNIDIGSQTYSLRIEGEMKESSELDDIVVANYGGKSIFLKDIASVRDSVQEKAQESFVNGKKGAAIVVQKQTGANSVEVMKQIRKQLPKIQKDLPPDIQLQEVMNTTDNIENSIASLVETFVLACLFVVIVVLFFLGEWRATIIIMVTIPVALIASFIYLFITGNTINIISLSSISIALGMVVDDAIVVLENVTTHIERGSKPREAAIYGTNEVGVAVIATTLTLIAVFFPFTMMTGMAGIMFKQLGWMICIIMVVSTASALSLTPMMCSLLLKREKDKTHSKLFTKIYSPIRRGLDKLDDLYEKLLTWAVRHKTVTICVATAIFVGSLLLGSAIGTDFIPASDNSHITGNLSLPAGANVDRTKEIAKRFQAKLEKDFPEVKQFTYDVGVPGDDSDNSFAMMNASGSNYMSFRIKLTDVEKRKRDMFEIADELRKEIASYTEVEKFSVSAGGQGGMTSGSTIDVEIFGYDFETTEKIAQTIKSEMEKIQGLKDVAIDRDEYVPQLQVDFDREKLALNGLNVATASTYVRNRMNGMTASVFREDGEEYKIKVRNDRSHRSSVEDIENILIYNTQGKAVRLSEVAKVVERQAPPSIKRQDRERVVKVSATLYGTTLDVAAAGIQSVIDKMDIPTEIGTKIGGSMEDQQESFSDMGMLLILILMLVYIVMAAQFESLRYPFIIMFSIPFAFVGFILSLFITGETINLMSLIGAIMLVGIVVKNGIVLVDYINLNRERGMGISQAVILGGKSRLRPVLMTSMTTILGMVPMSLGIGEGSELWQPMGIAIVGGLTVSTLVTLVIIPTVYCVFASREVKSYRKKNLLRLNNRTVKA
ncbi:MAG: efflux RND transporter permease subunit [Candidatus Onthomorpha sp.]|nr:efflux RND transporter permease subunit [Bacteroidales bacterium]MDY5826521.1 efflux RND transporter permease subunit [Candidatus Onthomorpha sp.]MCI7561836.1 efflux RND transporter permease subunit [Bacteroidales bacterium]MCI7700709.1 efflux RND transporter permease subunit [Bacteroidales bacterium]MDD5960883.1 efflux RND transporter permease subunit [Bacteroidales bacterium]